MDEATALTCRISSLPSADVESVLELMNDVECFQARAREVKRLLEQSLIEYIDEHGEIEVGDKRWYVSYDTSYKRRADVEQIATAVLEATSGDLDSFCRLLSSNAFKPAACRDALGSRFYDLFETVTERDLKTGKPKRVVKVLDKRFAK